MIRKIFILLSVCISSMCIAQVKDSYNGTVLMRVTTIGTSRDTTELLVTRNKKGDRLCVFTVTDGRVANGTAYSISSAKDGLYFYARPTNDGHFAADSLRIDFKDAERTVMVNRHDQYVLYQDYYTRFKQQVLEGHSVMPLLELLADGIADYPIEDAVPLILIDPPVDRRVESAIIVTQRTHSELQDTWHCVYQYDKSNRLNAVTATSGEEVGFTKKLQYEGGRISTVKSFLQKEGRKQTDRTIHYDPLNRPVLTWQDDVVEMGKNRETILSEKLDWRDIGRVPQLEPSSKSILNLVKTNKNAHPKKHAR